MDRRLVLEAELDDVLPKTEEDRDLDNLAAERCVMWRMLWQDVKECHKCILVTLACLGATGAFLVAYFIFM